jgi:PAS domain S-box-containing protein
MTSSSSLSGAQLTKVISPTLVTVLNASTDAVVIVNKAGVIQAVNTMATRMFGYAEEKLLGKSVSVLMPEPYRSVHQKLVQRYLDTNEAKVMGIGRPLRALHANGDEFEMFLTLTEIIDGDEHLFCGFIKNLSAHGPGSDTYLRSSSSRGTSASMLSASALSSGGTATGADDTEHSEKRSKRRDDSASDNDDWLPLFDAHQHAGSGSYWAEITPKPDATAGAAAAGAGATTATTPTARPASPSAASGGAATPLRSSTQGSSHTSRFSSDSGEQVREIDYAEIEFDSEKPLGKGAFGVVFKAHWRGVPVAVKKLLQYVDEEVLEQIRSECVLLQKCNGHPNIIKFIGMVHKGSTICIVTQFCAKGSLHQAFIVRRDPYTHAETCRILRDAALGVLHLHREHVIHRDIAARNVLLDEHDHVFVTDFGLARVKTSAYASTKSSIGPVQHMAPESIGKKQFSEKSDVFAFAVMMWEVTHRRDPYAGQEAFEIAMGVVQGTRLEIDEQLVGSAALVALLRQSWKSHPHERPEMTDIIKVLREEIAPPPPPPSTQQQT